jgi:hypothetical protein
MGLTKTFTTFEYMAYGLFIQVHYRYKTHDFTAVVFKAELGVHRLADSRKTPHPDAWAFVLAQKVLDEYLASLKKES